MKSLYENPGQKIKTVAKILFWVLVAASIFLAYQLGCAHQYRYILGYYRKFRAALFFPILIGGPLVSYAVSLLLYGYGELVENSKNVQKENSNK